MRIDESNNLCGLKLTMVTVCNSNAKIIPNIDYEFQSKNGGLDCFIITYIRLNANKRKLYKFF
jgi:hypothetical protein